MKKLIILITLMQSLSIVAQNNTVGLLSYDAEEIAEGYTLMFPRNQSTVFLLNNCGEIVHTWEDDSKYVPNNAVYILENGDLVKCKKHNNGWIGTGGGDYFIEIRSWENELKWAYELNTETERLHHDVEVLPNGNILIIAWEKRTADQAIVNGRIASTMTYDEIYPDYIFEIDPDSNEKVWEWHVWDHLIQDVDSTKLNYGVVSEHPELVDINYAENQGPLDWDWLHVNAIDYHSGLDQVMLCVPYFNEIWIIDHSTTTKEAASHEGGKYGKGGDLLYRIGNPLSYKKGTEEDKILFFPHDTHWANDFITTEHKYFGKMLVFNNRVENEYSKMEIFESSWDIETMSYKLVDGRHEPTSFANSIIHPDQFSFYSRGQSSVQTLPNGNVLGLSGGQGYIVELTPENKIVWEYVVPLKNGVVMPQGTELNNLDNLTFRAFKYPPEYIGFEGRDLAPKGFIELNPNVGFCDSLDAVDELNSFNLEVFPNPTKDFINLIWESSKEVSIKIIDMLGRERLSITSYRGAERIDLTDFETGNYILVFDAKEKYVITIL